MRSKKIALARRRIRDQNFNCPLCGKIMTFKACNVDHIIPKSRGGSDALTNLRLTHLQCNILRGNSMSSHEEELAHPLKNKRHIERRKKKRERDADITIDYTKAIKIRMDKYYAEVDARYIHPL